MNRASYGALSVLTFGNGVTKIPDSQLFYSSQESKELLKAVQMYPATF
jgi:hypothetical protein